jgi:hypothetical protein
MENTNERCAIAVTFFDKTHEERFLRHDWKKCATEFGTIGSGTTSIINFRAENNFFKNHEEAEKTIFELKEFLKTFEDDSTASIIDILPIAESQIKLEKQGFWKKLAFQDKLDAVDETIGI